MSFPEVISSTSSLNVKLDEKAIKYAIGEKEKGSPAKPTAEIEMIQHK